MIFVENLLIVDLFNVIILVFIIRNEFKLIKTLISCELIAKITCIREKK